MCLWTPPMTMTDRRFLVTQQRFSPSLGQNAILTDPELQIADASKNHTLGGPWIDPHLAMDLLCIDQMGHNLLQMTRLETLKATLKIPFGDLDRLRNHVHYLH